MMSAKKKRLKGIEIVLRDSNYLEIHHTTYKDPNDPTGHNDIVHSVQLSGRQAAALRDFLMLQKDLPITKPCHIYHPEPVAWCYEAICQEKCKYQPWAKCRYGRKWKGE